MDAILQRHRKALDKAIGNIGRVSGYTPLTIKDQLSAYNHMQPQDFDLIAKTYGLNQALGYITRMESLRAGG